MRPGVVFDILDILDDRIFLGRLEILRSYYDAPDVCLRVAQTILDGRYPPSGM